MIITPQQRISSVPQAICGQPDVLSRRLEAFPGNGLY